MAKLTYKFILNVVEVTHLNFVKRNLDLNLEEMFEGYQL